MWEEGAKLPRVKLPFSPFLPFALSHAAHYPNEAKIPKEIVGQDLVSTRNLALCLAHSDDRVQIIRYNPILPLRRVYRLFYRKR